MPASRPETHRRLLTQKKKLAKHLAPAVIQIEHTSLILFTTEAHRDLGNGARHNGLTSDTFLLCNIIWIITQLTRHCSNSKQQP
jgi:hypothetical protein